MKVASPSRSSCVTSATSSPRKEPDPPTYLTGGSSNSSCNFHFYSRHLWQYWPSLPLCDGGTAEPPPSQSEGRADLNECAFFLFFSSFPPQPLTVMKLNKQRLVKFKGERLHQSKTYCIAVPLLQRGGKQQQNYKIGQHSEKRTYEGK